MNNQIDYLQLCSENTLQAGVQFVQENRVELRQCTEEGRMVIRAKVIDQFNFVDRVSLVLNEDGTSVLDYSCTCQPVSKKRFCKHCAAAALRYGGGIPLPEDEPAEQETSGTAEDLPNPQDLVQQLEELSQLLRQLARQAGACSVECETEELHAGSLQDGAAIPEEPAAEAPQDFMQRERQIRELIQKLNQLKTMDRSAGTEKNTQLEELCGEIKRLRQVFEQLLKAKRPAENHEMEVFKEASSDLADEEKPSAPEEANLGDDADLESCDTCTDDPQGSGTAFSAEASEGAALSEYTPNSVPQGMEILFGHDTETGEPLLWRPNHTNEVFHTNTGIIGTMGTGKTQFTKSLITQLYRNQQANFDGKPLGILIFDYKGDYNESKMDFVQAVNAKVYRPYRLPLTPFALTKPRVAKNLLPIHVANTFIDTLGKIHHLGPKQRKRLLDSILEAYEVCGIRSDVPESWSKTPPTFGLVYEIYARKAESDNSDSLAAVMSKLESFQLFEHNPKNTVSLMQLLSGVVVLDLSGYDADIQHLIVAITLDLFYAHMQAMGSSETDGCLRQLTKFILVDEADNFMQENFSSLKKIMKEGREFGVGVILSTQYLDHFTTGKDDYSKYILSWVVHNVSNLKAGNVEYVFALKHGDAKTQNLCDSIRTLEKHHSIVKIGNQDPCEITDKAFWQLMCE